MDVTEEPVTAAEQHTRPDDGDRVPWSSWDAIAVLGLTIALNVAGVLALRGVLDGSSGALAVAIPLSVALTGVVTVIYVGLRYRGAVRRLLGPGPLRASDLALGVAWGLGGFLVVNVALGALVQVAAQLAGFELPPVQQSLSRALRTSELASATIASAVVLAPLTEELFFRGMLFQAIRRRRGAWVGAIVSGLVFGLAHVEPLLIGFTFLLGVFLARLLTRYGSLLVTIAAHATFNAIGVAAMLVAAT